LRFRFISDQSVTAEGWYIDDISVPVIVGIEENNSDKSIRKLTVLPNPFKDRTLIQWINGGNIKIYDASGRLVRKFNNYKTSSGINQVMWDGTDDNGKRLPGGVYFVKLTEAETTIIEKSVMLE
jgi:flagellar hook assembly protein FlgD